METCSAAAICSYWSDFTAVHWLIHQGEKGEGHDVKQLPIRSQVKGIGSWFFLFKICISYLFAGLMKI
jgi:hypothetical protein